VAASRTPKYVPLGCNLGASIPANVNALPQRHGGTSMVFDEGLSFDANFAAIRLPRPYD
jgi:hypothetical protein